MNLKELVALAFVWIGVIIGAIIAATNTTFVVVVYGLLGAGTTQWVHQNTGVLFGIMTIMFVVGHLLDRRR